MDEIEVRVKVTPNPQLYGIKIKNSDNILTLKKLCEKYTNIPCSLQSLVFEGRILSDTEIISDCKIENGQRIILVKKLTEPPESDEEEKEDQKANINTDNNMNINNININQKFNNLNGGLFDMTAGFFKNSGISDFENIKEKLGGIGQKTGLGDIDPRMLEGMLNSPQYMKLLKNSMKNPEILKLAFETASKKLKNTNPFLENLLNHYHKLLNDPKYSQITSYILSEYPYNNNPDLLPNMINLEYLMKNLDNDPFEFDIRQYSGLLGVKKEPNGLDGISLDIINGIDDNDKNINRNKIFDYINEANQLKKIEEKKNVEIDKKVSFEEKYKEDLDNLKNMGFNDEEKNIKILKECNGDINLTLDILSN